MPNKIQIKRTSVTGRTPNTTSSGNSSFIDTGELALNITDGKLFSSDGTNYIEVGANLQSINVASGFTANSTLVNAVALNVVNRANTATLHVTTSANVGTAFTVNSIAVTTSVNSNFDSGTLFVDTINNRVFVNATSATTGGTLEVNGETGTNPTASFIAGGNTLRVFPNSGAGAYNDLTSAGDVALVFSNGTTGFGNLMIGSWFAGRFGIKLNSGANSIIIAGNTVNVTTALTIGSMSLTSALANLQALNVVNQTNTATLYVTTSANVASAFLVNSTGAYHTGTINAASHTVGTTTIVNSTAISLGPFGVTNGASITTTSIDVGNSTANAALDYNIIYVANSSSRANLSPTTLAIGSITVNSALANLQALNVVNQTNTATLFVTTSANVGTNVQITTNSFRLGNASSNVNITNTSITHLSNSAFNPQVIVRNSNNDEFGPYWNAGKSRAGAAVQNNDDLGTFMFQGHDGTDFRNTAYIIAEVDGTVSTSNVPSKMLFFTTNTSGNLLNRLTIFANGNVDVNNGILTIGGGPAVTNGSSFTNTTIKVGNSTINTTANSTTILVNGVDLVATQKRAIAMSMVFGR